jgi:hypothetical protein
MTKATTENYWTGIASAQLKGRTVKAVRYMSEEEAQEMMLDSRPVAIFFDDGSFVFPMRDDEGNDGGALFTSDDANPVLPVI